MGAFNDFVAQSGAADGAFLQLFGETVVRWPLGVEANDANVTAIVDKTFEVTGRRGINPELMPHIRDPFEEQVNRLCLLDIPIGQAWDLDDQWVIDGDVWNTTRQLGEDEGMRTLILERGEPLHTSKGGRIT